MSVLSLPGYSYATAGPGGSTYPTSDAWIAGGGLAYTPNISNPSPPPSTAYPSKAPIPIPASGTNFSVEALFRPFAWNNTAGDVVVTNVKAGKYQPEPIAGTKWWYEILASSASLPSVPPTPTNDNNVTAPTMKGGAGAALPLMADGGVLVDAGPKTKPPDDNTALCTNWIGLVLGVDSTCTAVSDTGYVGNALNLQFTWSEA